MNIFLSTVTIAVIFGTYDVFIKLGAGRIDPALGAWLTQLASTLTLTIFLCVQLLTKKAPGTPMTGPGLLIVTVAGVLIALALAMLFFLLQNKAAQATTTLPTILFLRNITLVILGIFILREQVTIIKITGVVTCLFGIYLISL